MIANIWGEAQQIEETISTLRFATRMMCISIEAAVNEFYDPVLVVKKLEKEIAHLKQELAMHDTLVSVTGSLLKKILCCKGLAKRAWINAGTLLFLEVQFCTHFSIWGASLFHLKF